MTIKNILLAGSAVAFLTAAPAMAQDTTPPAPAPAAAQAPSLTLTPGATVRGADGELGKLEGVQTNGQGQQELTVRGADGQVRGVPLAGIRQDGADVVVGFTKAEYDAAAQVTGAPTANPPAAESSTPPAEEPIEPTEAPAPSEPQS